MWLDWLVFEDPAVEPLKGHEIFISDAGAAELARVLAYDLGKHSIDADAQAACLNEVHRLARFITETNTVALPRCTDPADQVFLEAAAAARADYLVTKDRALLDMDGRLPFRVATPDRVPGT